MEAMNLLQNSLATWSQHVCEAANIKVISNEPAIRRCKSEAGS